MKFRKIGQYFYRWKLLSNNFFEDVCCNNKQTKKDILYWMLWLYRKGISINKFSDLFSKYENIQFPIKVYRWSRTYFTILDSHADEYHIIYYPYDYKKLETYSIGREMYPFDKEITFQLTPENEIILKETDMVQLDEDKNNTENSFSFVYDDNTTTAIIKQEKSKLEIIYTSQNREFDDKVLNYLVEVASKEDFNDVFPILIGMRRLKNLDSLSIEATGNSEEVISNITVTDNIVTKYSFSEKINDSEVCLHQTTPSKRVEEFIAEHQN